MPEVKTITPDQIPQLIVHEKNTIAALTHLLEKKKSAMNLLELMEERLAAFDVPGALTCLAQVQKIEYQMQIDGFEVQLSGARTRLNQLENPVLMSTMVGPGGLPPAPGTPGHGQGNLKNPARR
jgi:hypothetical protein